jgi:hypothetical protein
MGRFLFLSTILFLFYFFLSHHFLLFCCIFRLPLRLPDGVRPAGVLMFFPTHIDKVFASCYRYKRYARSENTLQENCVFPVILQSRPFFRAARICLQEHHRVSAPSDVLRCPR